MTILKSEADVQTVERRAPSYGYFDDAAREYVVTNPRTPYPWINYLGLEDFHGLISNTGGGYAFYRDAKLRRLTRYRYNNVPLDDGGRYFYLRDGNEVWSPGWKPVKTELDFYSCRHGLGYSVIRGVKNDLMAEALYFVPLGTTAEVHHLKLENQSRAAKKVQLFSFLEWCLWNAETDMNNFQRNFSTGEIEVDGSVIYHKTEYRERRDHFSFYSVNHPIDGFDTDREAFLGIYNGFADPGAVMEGKPRQSLAHGWSPIASHYLELDLAPGQEIDLVFVLGYVQNEENAKWTQGGGLNKAKAEAMIERLSSIHEVEAAWSEQKGNWQNLLGDFTVASGDPRLDRLVNVWNPYQCVVTFNLSRSASLFESGVSRGIGFRDSNQDLLGSVHNLSARSRQRILDLASTQMSGGSAFHQYQPLTKEGNADIGSGFNDDPLWLIVSTAAYIKETGDLGILDAAVGFADDDAPGHTLFDHLTASFGHVVEHRGPHGLPLIGRADWNDCMNLNTFSMDPDESFQTAPIVEDQCAESLMIAGLFVWSGRDYVELCRRTGRDDEAARAKEHIAAMVAAVDEHGWDGDWFLRAYRHDGEKVGSHENEEGRIFIESQGFCVMAGIGLDDGRALKALDSVQEHLDCEHGVMLNHPAYSRYHLAMGEISSYPEGYKENGAVFCHTNPWIVIAETLVGRGDRAFEVYRKTAPSYLEGQEEVHRTEPYVYSQMIAGALAHRPGEAKNSWLTGTAAWTYMAVTQHVLGIRPHYDGLVVDPCIPPDWPGFRVTRRFRGVTYEIEVENSQGVSQGVAEMTVDGEAVADGVVPVFKSGTVHQIRVRMG